jgi:hypothetical protein
MKTILVFSTKRSGHHAIIEWIGRNMDNGLIFHNDVQWRLFVQGIKRYRGKRKEIVFGGKTKKDLTIYNFEDININQHMNILQSPFTTGYIKTLIPLRDVYNMVASSIKSTPKNTDTVIRKRVDRWKEYCLEVLGRTDYVTASKLHFINYNLWFIDREYRDLIGRSLGFENKDYGIKNVTKFGGGSSFQKVSDARNLDVLDRWRDYRSHKLFDKHITEEVDELNKEMFGFNLEDLKNGYY